MHRRWVMFTCLLLFAHPRPRMVLCLSKVTNTPRIRPALCAGLAGKNFVQDAGLAGRGWPFVRARFFGKTPPKHTTEPREALKRVGVRVTVRVGRCCCAASAAVDPPPMTAAAAVDPPLTIAAAAVDPIAADACCCRPSYCCWCCC